MRIDRDIEARALHLANGSAAARPLTPDQLAIRVAWLLGRDALADDDAFKAFCLHKRNGGGLISVEIAQAWRNGDRVRPKVPAATRLRPCFDDLDP